MSEVLLRQHTRREFRQRMESGELQGVILPVAAIEQHLEHLAMEHDWRSAVHVATRVAERLAPRVVVAEGVMAAMRRDTRRAVVGSGMVVSWGKGFPLPGVGRDSGTR